MSNNDNDNIEILDVENYSSGYDKAFSHQALVMRSMTKVIELGTKELHPGWIETKKDSIGNVSNIYREDTRKSFIEAVKTCVMVMFCDYDDAATKNISKLEKEIKEKKAELLKEEWENWQKIPEDLKKILFAKGKHTRKGYFNKDYGYYEDFIEAQVEIHREIFKELTLLTKRLEFYAEQIFEA